MATLAAPLARAKTHTVELLPSEAGGVYAELMAIVQREAAALGPGLTLTQRMEPTEGGRQLVLALGTKALRDAAQRAAQSPAWAQIPVLAALLPQSAWRSLAAGLPRGSSAIWLDQPLERFVELARQALPQRRRLGVLFGPSSKLVAPLLERAATTRGMSLVKATVEVPATDLFPALQGVLQDSDVLLALPDPVLYNAESLQNILIATYRQRVPMISYTASHVRAGVTMALHTPIDEVATQVVRVLRQFVNLGTLPAPETSHGFVVVVNEQVARSLALGLPETAELQAAVRKAEGRP